ncbi:MAG: tRNA (adenosine(37)-N6)-threonylcarbamoyltransferase complex ATPase subunit type 1 TsaE [Lachnospiraceae bacterium]|nr:tRNA (adenosine(37)-N6)-threonylcarbamoyltransferase complex ATPase subunit type 1 TsaE [Lachnospiraceae bacterium]
MIVPETKIHSSSEKETFEFAKKLGQSARKGSVYGLIGDLGAGKSVFARGFAQGLGVTEYVSSPTFNILNCYETGRLALYHFDVYRIEDPDEMYETGFDEYLGGDGICLIEWSDMIRELMPEGYIRVELTKDPDDIVSGRWIRIREEGTKK